MRFYSDTKAKVLEHFKVKPNNGLDENEIERSRKENGTNEILVKKEKSSLILLFEQFNNPIIYILIVAAIVNYFAASPKDAIVIAVVVFLNTMIGYVQERKASKALKSLKEMASPDARVIRNGKQQNIPTREVVVGDILVLESGVRAPADARLIETHNLTVDESMLTGESFTVIKNADAEIDEEAPLGDRLTMVYSGTIIQKGRGLAVVTAVGTSTEFGQISERISETEETESPLQKQIANFGKGLSIAILVAVIGIFIIGIIRGTDWVLMMMTAVGLAVSAIPEGLPVAVTITLSIGIYQMAKHQAIVKKLAAVETLGSTNVICTDKTGTLTKNQMTTTNIFAGGELFDVSGSGYEAKGEVTRKGSSDKINFNNNPALEYFNLVGALCTESSISEKNGSWEITGDPTEAAITIATRKMDFSSDSFKVFVDIPFESENQLMAVRAINNSKYYILAKGASEKILDICSYMIDNKGDLVDFNKDELLDKVYEFSNHGFRVISLAYSEVESDNQIDIKDLQDMKFVGFAVIQDAVRPEAIEAVEDCNNAGIKVVMITGDHIKTAQAIAKEVKIVKDDEEVKALNGVALEKMDDDQLFNEVTNTHVYARVAPQHKFRIVEQIQKHNKIVAMTGDGVNDAPALKKSDIGVAMGSGTDVAKEAAHMVLMNDNFATIVQAVRRGRVVLHNLQHILLYILATSFGGVLTIATSVALGFPLPLLPAQLLWVNLVTDGTSTFPLAFEKEHGNVMTHKPRRKDDPLITRDILYRISFAAVIMMFGTLGVFYMSAEDIYNPTDTELVYAQTMAFCILAFFQIWNVQNSRSVDRSLFFNLPGKKDKNGNRKKLQKVGVFTNPILLGVMVLAIVLQVAAVEISFMNDLMHTMPLSLSDWGIVAGVTFSIVIFVEIGKFLWALFKS
jgi:magnesium-transporting ATPase (P-type)